MSKTVAFVGPVSLVSALFLVSCAGSSDFSPFPTAPTAISDSSDVTSEDEPISTRSVGEVEINALGTSTFVVSGIVTDKSYPAWKISGATVTITPGTVPVVRTSSTGQYTTRLRAGTWTIKIAKAGYATATIKKVVTGTTTLNVPLTASKPTGATARCNDRTWSFSKTRSGTCSSHKGVAYWLSR